MRCTPSERVILRVYEQGAHNMKPPPIKSAGPWTPAVDRAAAACGVSTDRVNHVLGKVMAS